MSAMTEKFISIEGIAKRFPAAGGGTTTVFEDLWLPMQRGDFTCIIGHSGCGKTTVLNILAGLDTPSEGAVIVDNQGIEGPSLDARPGRGRFAKTRYVTHGLPQQARARPARAGAGPARDGRGRRTPGSTCVAIAQQGGLARLHASGTPHGCRAAPGLHR